MRVIVVTPPEALVDWTDAREHLRLDSDDEQALVIGMIAAASAMIDGPTGWLGRAIGQQTLEARFDGFDPSSALELPYPPLLEVMSIAYLDATGATIALAGAAFETFGNIVEPVFGTLWPATRLGRETVRVRYQAGYADLPPAIRAAILLMVGDLWENRSSTLDARAAGAAAVPMSTTVENLLGPFRVWR